MKRLLALVACALVPILASASLAQAGDGYVGIYTDAAGTTPCTTVPPLSSTTLYVIAKLEGASTAGITGVEFRIEVENPAGWWISYTAPAANIVMGNALDLNPQDPDDGSGVSIAFGACREPVAGNVPLGTISVINITGSATRLFVKRHSTPTNAGFPCALFTLCVDPAFPKSCMTPSTQPQCSLSVAKMTVQLSEVDPVVFTTVLNDSGTGGGMEPPPSDPDREALVMFKRGIVEFPLGVTGATVEGTAVSSSQVASVLEAHSVTYIAKGFPAFDLADTVGVTPSGEVVRLADLSEVYVLTVPEGGAPAALAAELVVLTDDVVYAEANVHDIKPDMTVCEYETSCSGPSTVTIECPNDPKFQQQWALFSLDQPITPLTFAACFVDINVTPAWKFTRGSGIKVGVIDTGILHGHEDLIGKSTGDPEVGNYPSGFGHGTSVASIIAAHTDNGLGIAGIAGNVAEVISKDIYDGTPFPVAAKVMSAVNEGARVINMSFGSYTEDFYERIAMRNAYMLNAVLVASMGNDNTNTKHYPSAYPGVIAVGGILRDGTRWMSDLGGGGSNFGSYIDVVAPAQFVWAAAPEASFQTDVYNFFDATSCATPHVSGLAALLLAYNGDLSNDDIEQIIRLSAVHPDGLDWDQFFGTGLIKAGAAIDLLKAPNRLRQWEVTGGTENSLGTHSVNFAVSPAPGIEAGWYFVEKIEVRREVTFPSAFASVPAVWGRGSAPNSGYSPEQPFNYSMGWCRTDGTVYPDRCTLHTYVYRIALGDHQGRYLPVHPSNVRFAYTALGEMTPTDVGREETRPNPVTLSAENPLRDGSSIHLDLAHDADVEVEIFNVAGRGVRLLHKGRLVAGSHTFPWDGLDDLSRSVADGVYFVQVRDGNRKTSRKVVVLR